MTSNTKFLLVYSLFLLLIGLVYCPALLAYENSPQSLKHLKIAKIYVEKGLYEKAKKELEAGLKDDPKSPDILNNIGAIYLRLGQSHKGQSKSDDYLEQARSYFTKALDTDPDFPSAWNGLADTYYLSGNTQQAISYYKKALSLSPKNAYEAQTNLANAQRDLGLLTEAQNNYQKAIESNPLYAPAHHGYAELLLNKKELTQAYSEILEAIRLKPNYAIAYYHLGLLESARGNKMQALKAYLLSLRYETNASYAQETQGLINKLELDSNKISFAELQKYQAELCQSLSATDTQSKIQKQLPVINKTDKEDSAINKTLPNAKASIANIEALIATKQWTKAHKEISTLLNLHPDDAVLLNESGLIFFNQKKYSQAEKVLTESITKSQNKLGAAYYNLAQVYLAQHQSIKAQSALERANSLSIEKGENTALINNSLAICLKQKGDFQAAQSAYNEAIKSGGDNFPVIHYNLAILLEQMDKPAEAAQEFKTYLSLAPHGLNAAKAQSHLKTFYKNPLHLGSR
jgi:tetratricopeptide (TPR) repeat protein